MKRGKKENPCAYWEFSGQWRKKKKKKRNRHAHTPHTRADLYETERKKEKKSFRHGQTELN
jgi:hypothetical protein